MCRVKQLVALGSPKKLHFRGASTRSSNVIRHWFSLLKPLCLLGLAGSVAAINGCEGWSRVELEPQTIRVVSLRDPLTVFRQGEGFEYDLIWHFAQNNHAQLQWKWVKTPQEAIDLLATGKADIAAGRWSSESFEINPQVLTGPNYEEPMASLVCRRDMKSQKEIGFFQNLFSKQNRSSPDLIENQFVRVGIHKRDLIPDLESELFKVAPQWNVQRGLSSPLGLAREVAQKKIDCFVTDSTTARWIESLRPWLKVTRELNFRFSKTFLFSAQKTHLQTAFTSWLQRQNRKGLIARVRNRYFGFQKSLVASDRTRLFRAKMQDLPELMPKFKLYAKQFDLPWELLAAVAYQESHWNTEARSHTGVRGMMQITMDTALRLGVDDREDLDQSLWGGAKYLRFLIDRQPVSSHPRERLAMALAAYNVGPSHLRDAQKLAMADGMSANSFWNVRMYLPMLSDPAIAEELDFGGARGDEPVQFTERVLAFYDLLSDH